MNILMITPQVFFSERGTPLSAFYRAKALCELGHTVDVLTYHLGKQVKARNMRIIRIWQNPIKNVKAGPSWAKFPLDFLLLCKALAVCRKEKYDILYAHEEGVFIGLLLKKLHNIPLMYDMHSSLPLQFRDWGFSKSGWLRKIAEKFEQWAINGSDAVVSICRNLTEIAKKISSRKKIITIENTAVVAKEGIATAKQVAKLRRRYQFREEKIVLYTGTFLSIQGLELLMQSIPLVARVYQKVKFVFVGGRGQQEMDWLQSLAKKYKAEKYSILEGSRPQEEMPAYMALADILVSPRSIGINAPLKIFSYLKSGKPIVATDLPIHTQLIEKESAMLRKPTPRDFAEGILKLLQDPALAQKIGAAGKKLLQEKYSYAQYKKKLAQAVQWATGAEA